jgi:hypothetical protein
MVNRFQQAWSEGSVDPDTMSLQTMSNIALARSGSSRCSVLSGPGGLRSFSQNEPPFFPANAERLRRVAFRGGGRKRRYEHVSGPRTDTGPSWTEPAHRRRPDAGRVQRGCGHSGGDSRRPQDAETADRFVPGTLRRASRRLQEVAGCKAPRLGSMRRCGELRGVDPRCCFGRAYDGVDYRHIAEGIFQRHGGLAAFADGA